MWQLLLKMVAISKLSHYFSAMEETATKVFPIFRRNDLLLQVDTLEWITDEEWCITIRSGLPAPINTETMIPVYVDEVLDHWLCD